MEILFKSSFIRDNALAKDVYQYMFFKRPLNLLLDIVLLVVFCVNLFVSVWTQVWDNALYLVLIPFFYGYQIYAYNRAVNIMIKQEKEINQGEHISVVIAADAEGIHQTTSTGTETALPYGDMKKAMTTKKSIMIQSYDNLLYTIGRKGFTKGNAEDFIAFLKEKGVKVSGK